MELSTKILMLTNVFTHLLFIGALLYLLQEIIPNATVLNKFYSSNQILLFRALIGFLIILVFTETTHLGADVNWFNIAIYLCLSVLVFTAGKLNDKLDKVYNRGHIPLSEEL
jgi:hypothetical protein